MNTNTKRTIAGWARFLMLEVPGMACMAAAGYYWGGLPLGLFVAAVFLLTTSYGVGEAIKKAWAKPGNDR